MLYESTHLGITLNDRIATLSLDFDGTRPNLFNVERLLEIERAIECVERSGAEVLVIRSAKIAGFCAGIDADAFENLTTDSEAREFAAIGQRVMNRIALSSCSTLAFLHGPVHDAGLDLALACDYRLAIATPTTTLGYPELRNGTLSPWGGLTRLTRILGASATVELLTAAEPLTAREAHRIGLVDDAFSERRAKIELRTFLDHLRRKPRRWHTPLDGWAASRVVAAFEPFLAASAQVAMTAAVRVVPIAAPSEAAGLLAERAAFAGVMANADAQAAFDLRQDELRFREVTEAMLPATIAAIGPLKPIADLILESLLRGSRVVAFDVDDSSDDSALETAPRTSLEQGRVTPLEADQARSRFICGTDETRTDLVLFSSDAASALELAETLAKPNGLILAVNADLAALLELCSRPRNFAGLNRAADLVEIVRSPLLAASVMSQAQSWLNALEITTLVVNETPLVMPLLVTWWDEAVRLVADGLPIDLVDRAAKALGAAAGPLETLDGVGFDAAVAQVPRIKPLLAAGIHGRPHRDGFYVLADDNPTCANAVAQLVLLEAANAKPAARIAEPLSEDDAAKLCERRLTARLLVAASKRLSRDPHISPAEIDIAIVRGLGLFARHGGLLRHVDRGGLTRAVGDLQQLQRTFGQRFKPPRDLVRRAAAGETFHCDAGPFEESRLKRSA